MPRINGPFPSQFQKNPHFQNEAKRKPFLVKMRFIYIGIKNHFHINGFVFSHALKQKLGATRKWPIGYSLGFTQMRCVEIFLAPLGKEKVHTKLNAKIKRTYILTIVVK